MHKDFGLPTTRDGRYILVDWQTAPLFESRGIPVSTCYPARGVRLGDIPAGVYDELAAACREIVAQRRDAAERVFGRL